MMCKFVATELSLNDKMKLQYINFSLIKMIKIVKTLQGTEKNQKK